MLPLGISVWLVEVKLTVSTGLMPSRNERELFSYQTSGAVNTSPAVANGRVYFGSDDGYFYVLELPS